MGERSSSQTCRTGSVPGPLQHSSAITMAQLKDETPVRVDWSVSISSMLRYAGVWRPLGPSFSYRQALSQFELAVDFAFRSSTTVLHIREIRPGWRSFLSHGENPPAPRRREIAALSAGKAMFRVNLPNRTKSRGLSGGEGGI